MEFRRPRKGNEAAKRQLYLCNLFGNAEIVKEMTRTRYVPFLVVQEDGQIAVFSRKAHV